MPGAQAWKWYYDGVWKNNFMPNADYQNSDLLAKGNPSSSGNVAMWWTHTWYTCCFDLAKTKWDIAVVPTINGKTTAKLHGDTFAIMKDSKNKDAAFKVLTQMVVAPELFDIYGGIPAVASLRPAFFAGLDKRAAPNKVDWTVAEAMLKYPDLPNHESWLPNMVKANDLFTAFRTLMDQTPGLDMDWQINKLKSDLDVVFKETGGGSAEVSSTSRGVFWATNSLRTPRLFVHVPFQESTYDDSSFPNHCPRAKPQRLGRPSSRDALGLRVPCALDHWLLCVSASSHRR